MSEVGLDIVNASEKLPHQVQGVYAEITKRITTFAYWVVTVRRDTAVIGAAQVIDANTSPMAPAFTSASARFTNGSPSSEWLTQTQQARTWLSGD